MKNYDLQRHFLELSTNLSWKDKDGLIITCALMQNVAQRMVDRNRDSAVNSQLVDSLTTHDQRKFGQNLQRAGQCKIRWPPFVCHSMSVV